MDKRAEQPSGRDSLGTPWRFEVFPGKLGVVYGVTVGKTRFRIAPDDIQKDKWRIDHNTNFITWTPINQIYYTSAKEAARDLVRLHEAGKLKTASDLEVTWGLLAFEKTAGPKGQFMIPKGTEAVFRTWFNNDRTAIRVPSVVSPDEKIDINSALRLTATPKGGMTRLQVDLQTEWMDRYWDMFIDMVADKVVSLGGHKI